MFERVAVSTTRMSRLLFGANSDLAVALIYKRWKSTDFDTTLKQNVTLFDTFEFNGIKANHTFHSAQQSAANVQAGDIYFLIQQKDAPSEMSLKDHLQNKKGTEKYSVKFIEPIEKGLFYVVHVESSAS